MVCEKSEASCSDWSLRLEELVLDLKSMAIVACHLFGGVEFVVPSDS